MSEETDRLKLTVVFFQVVSFVLLMLLIATTLKYLNAESRRQFWLDAYTQQLTLRNDVRADTNLLCAVNYTLEQELNLQTKWKGFWGEDMKEICQ